MIGGSFDDSSGAMREEWRADEEEWSRAAASQWEHGRRLVDIARELMHRGDTVAVQVGETVFTGTVRAVGEDLLTLTTPGGPVEVQLAFPAPETPGGERVAAPVALRVVERARAGGRAGRTGVESFRARLLELEAGGVEVALGSLLLRDELRGVLTVGRDQLLVRARDGAEAYVPTAWVSWVKPLG